MLRFKIFQKYSEVSALVTDTRVGSINPFRDDEAERKVAKIIRTTPDKIVFADQVHGANFHICTKSDGGSIRLQCDALIIHEPNLYLVVRTADCLPLLLFEPQKQVVAAVHAGRKSLVGGIIKNTIKGMKKNFGVSPLDILVGIGPHIRVEDYYLKKKALEELKNSSLKQYCQPIKGRLHFNLTRLVLDQLKEVGLKNSNIEDCGISTYQSFKDYFSARKNEEVRVYKEKMPLFVSIIGLKR